MTLGKPAGVDTTDFYESLLNAQADLGIGVTIIDGASGRYVYANDAACRISGYSQDELLALDSFWAVIPDDERQALADRISAWRTGERTEEHYETTVQRKDGTRVAVDIAAKVLEGGRLLAIVRDITERKRAEEALRAAEEKYRGIFENAVDGIYQTTLEGEVVSVNHAAARILGYRSPQELMTAVADAAELYAQPSQRDEFVEMMRRRGVVSDFVYQMRRKDGATIWVRETARAVRDPGGEVTGFEGTVRDVTDEVLIQAATEAISSDLDPTRAVESFAQVLRSAVPFTHLTLPLVEEDMLRRLVSVGAFTDEFPQGERMPIEGTPMESVVRTNESIVMRDTRRSPYSADERLRRAGLGSYVVVPLVSGGRTFATFNLAFTEPDSPTDAMLALLSSLSVSVAQAVQHIVVFEQQREAIARLRELDRLKDDFVAMVAHDLRSPMALISGLSRMLLAKRETLPDDQADLLERLANNVTRMSRLVEDVLQVARLESGALQFEIKPFDLGDLVETTVTEIATQSPHATVDVDVPSDLEPALGDRQRQWQILSNLLTNALKFSREHPRVHVRVQRDGSRHVVSVSDDGPGIAPDDVDRIFAKFSRLPNALSAQGSGLGLYLCKMMVEAQGGEIWVDSKLGSGSTFRYTVPVADA